jgi:hypothetical protein
MTHLKGKQRGRTKKIIAVFLLITIVAGILTGCSGKQDEGFQRMEDFEQAQIGILTGSSHDQTVKEFFPNATRVYFNNMSDMILAVEQGKIDCYVEDEPFLIAALWEGANVKRMAEPVKQVQNGFAFPQSEESRKLREEVNAFIAAAKADGTIDRLKEKWLSNTEPTEHPDYTTLTGENGTIHLAVVVENKPMVYLHNELCTGFEIELRLHRKMILPQVVGKALQRFPIQRIGRIVIKLVGLHRPRVVDLFHIREEIVQRDQIGPEARGPQPRLQALAHRRFARAGGPAQAQQRKLRQRRHRLRTSVQASFKFQLGFVNRAALRLREPETGF